MKVEIVVVVVFGLKLGEIVSYLQQQDQRQWFSWHPLWQWQLE